VGRKNEPQRRKGRGGSAEKDEFPANSRNRGSGGCSPVLWGPFLPREPGGSVPLAGQHFGFLLVGVDLQADVHVLPLGDGFQDAADGGGAEAVATDQERDVGLAKDELETQPLRTEFGDLELGFGRELDELDGDVLEKIPDLIGNQLHVGMMPRSGGRAS